ncbi:MAG: hypothetical protein WA765_19800 [Candidatus Acidiferrum sp.]
MRREVPYLRPPLATLVLMACVCMPFLKHGAQDARRSPRKLPKVEIKLSGPTTVRPGKSLELQRYTALLTNRSAEPLVLFVRQGFLMNANWDWWVTDAKGQPVGMELVMRGYCGTVPGDNPKAHFLHDDDVLILGPGESYEFAIPAGPSDDYSFPSAGTYHLAVTLTYVPPNATYYFDERGKRQPSRVDTQWDLSQLGVDQRAAMENSLSVQATSDAWNLELPSMRRVRP